jgi:hypothetical protein
VFSATTRAGACRCCLGARCRLAASKLPTVYIYQPAPSPTQSGLARRHEWGLEFAPWAPRELEPLMGWTSSRDPFATIPPLRFPDKQSAIEFAERRGWTYQLREPLARRFRPKSYADNFRYEPAGPIAQAHGTWNGPAIEHSEC